jgi:hypothetical protein
LHYIGLYGKEVTLVFTPKRDNYSHHDPIAAYAYFEDRYDYGVIEKERQLMYKQHTCLPDFVKLVTQLLLWVNSEETQLIDPKWKAPKQNT